MLDDMLKMHGHGANNSCSAQDAGGGESKRCLREWRDLDMVYEMLDVLRESS